jgi:hypothetical protein
MRQITYSCDICRNECKDERHLLGIKYVDLRSSKSIQVGTHIEEADAHICRSCASTIKNAIDKGFST